MRFGGLLAAAGFAALFASAEPALARNNKDTQLASLPPNPVIEQADHVIVYKSLRRLVLMQDGRVLKAYTVALGKRPAGPKLFAGDLRTPEGRYHIDSRLRNSGFHRALHISYPNEADLARSEILNVDPGGQIMIHGLPNGRSARTKGHPYKDWTAGCIAVTNEEIQEIWAMVPDGTPIDILP
jgi:murein L,D-transpeptidase YafK